MEAPRFVGIIFLGGSINGSQMEPSQVFRSHFKHSREPLKEPPNNLVPTDLGAAMPEFTTCERTIFVDK